VNFINENKEDFELGNYLNLDEDLRKRLSKYNLIFVNKLDDKF